MKSREEYQASIFAKKDALLAKRRKRITQSAAALSIIICFAVAFAFLPKRFGHESVMAGGTLSQVKSTEGLTAPLPETDFTQESTEAFTLCIPYTKPSSAAKAHSEKAAAAKTQPAIQFANTATQIHLPNQETEIAQEAEGTTRKGFGGFSPEIWDEDGFFEAEGNTTPDDSPDYTTEEIAAKAKTYLDGEIADGIIDKHTMVTVTHSASGSDSYTVWFYTDNKQIKVKLNSENLELIEINEKELADDTQTTPAYIPSTAKPAMTTAAPAYIPE